MEMENLKLEKMMRFIEEKNLFGKVTWKFDNGVKFFVNCDNVFWYATADSEEIDEYDLELLKKSLEDSKNGVELFCARKRKMRPQGKFYILIPQEEHKFFDACGKYRATGHRNPVEVK